MKPLSSSQLRDAVHRQHVAGRDRQRMARRRTSLAGTRWSAALTVVSRIDGLSRPLSGPAATARSCAAPRRRHAATPGHKAGSPRPGIPAARSRARRRPARAPAPPSAARRGRPRGGWLPVRSAARRPPAPDRRSPALRRRPRRWRASAAGRSTSMVGRRIRHHRVSAPPDGSRSSLPNSARVESAGTLAFAEQPGERSRSGSLEQLLEIAEFGVAEVRDGGVGEPPQDQVGFAHAAMPGPEQQPCAGAHPGLRSIACCQSWSPPTPKARTGRAAVI